METNKIILGDSYSIIKDIPDNSIDLVIIDPPYNFGSVGGGIQKKRTYMNEISDKKLTVGLNNEILGELTRVMKKTNIYIFCSKGQLKQLFDYYDGHTVDLLVWHKTNPIPTFKNKYLPDLEYIVFVREKGVPMYNEYSTSSKLYQSSVNKQDKKLYRHPTVKPLDLIEKFVKNSTKPGDVVFDCFSGTGTTCVAAKKLGRCYLGIEIDEESYHTSIERLKII